MYSNEHSLRDFRFRVTDMGKICDAMSWIGDKTKRNGYRCDPITACCIVLRRLASPCRWQDVEFLFGMRSSALSEVFWEVAERFVYSKGYLITDLRQNLLVERAPIYAEAIQRRGAPLDSCIGFIDCTKIEMARPGGNGTLQRACYSGHKRMHCLIYQTITTPDGLIFSLYGPEVGRRHDITLLRHSGVETTLQCLNVNGRQYCIFGDPAYILRPWLQTAFERLGATESEADYNKAMSALRVSVEWSYKDVKQMWTINDFARKLHVRKAPIAILYQSSVLLFNFKTCLEGGGQVGSFFKCDPPSLQTYLTST